MPEGLEEMLTRNPAVFAPEVSILTSLDGNIEATERILRRSRVAYTVRRTMGATGVTLQARGLQYSGPTAAKRFIKDRALLPN